MFLDWDTSNTTVKDNWIYNAVGGAVKVIFGGNQNVVDKDNKSSEKPVEPPFVNEVGPAGTASHGIDPKSLGRTGSVIHYTDIAHAEGTAHIKWNMRTGTQFDFAVVIGTYRFKAGGNHTVAVGTAGADGKVIADAVAFVKAEENNKVPGNP